MPDTGVPGVLIAQPQLFDRAGLYGEGGQDYPANLLRFQGLCRGMLAWLERQPWQTEIIHCHDWQTALVPAIIGAGQVRRAATLLTIHNLAYQGLFSAEQFEVTGLPPSMYTMAGLEFWGQVNLLKGGLVFADLLNTVSETYAQEIQTAEFGAGLDGVLRDRSRDLFGILNGVDYGVWDPAHDPLIPARYTAGDLSGERAGKNPLQDEFGLAADSDIPLIGMVTRLADQKGLDLVAAILDTPFAAGAQLIVLGTGDPPYERMFSETARRHPRKSGVRIGFDNALAHRIEAGADLFLMPSRYRSEEHTSELQSQSNLVCRLLLEKKKKQMKSRYASI